MRLTCRRVEIACFWEDRTPPRLKIPCQNFDALISSLLALAHVCCLIFDASEAFVRRKRTGYHWNRWNGRQLWWYRLEGRCYEAALNNHISRVRVHVCKLKITIVIKEIAIERSFLNVLQFIMLIVPVWTINSNLRPVESSCRFLKRQHFLSS